MCFFVTKLLPKKKYKIMDSKKRTNKENLELLKKRNVPHRYRILKSCIFIRKVISPIDNFLCWDERTLFLFAFQAGRTFVPSKSWRKILREDGRWVTCTVPPYYEILSSTSENNSSIRNVSVIVR